MPSVTQPVPIHGTDANIGITLDAIPTIQPDKKLAVKIRWERRDVVKGVRSSIRTTSEVQTHVFLDHAPLVIRRNLEASEQTPNAAPQTLLVFVNAMTVQQRL